VTDPDGNTLRYCQNIA